MDIFQQGKSCASVDRYYVVNESTVHYIMKNKVEARTTVAVSFCDCSKKMTIVRKKHLVRMESALAFLISDCNKKNISLIRETVRKLYQQSDRRDGTGSTEEP